MRKIKKWNYLKIGILLFGISLFLWNCDQNELINTVQNQSNNTNTIKTVSLKDIPNVINFIQSESNTKMEFNLSSNTQDGFMRNNHEENLVLASVVTDQIKQITNGYGKSNYTFKLIEQETKEGVYFLNLVVKEYKDSFYLYIVKYVPSINWIRNYRSETDFDNFTGFIYIYNSDGVYAGYSEFNNGTSISINKSYPCPDTDDNNSNSSGGGSTYDDATNTSNSSGTNSYDSLFGGNFGGTNCSWSIYTQYNCSCNGELVGVHDHIPSTIVVELFCGDINKSMRNMIDCPPYDTEEECFLVNGDPCPNGCDANGNCIQDIDEIENSNISINIDREDFVSLGDLLNHELCNNLNSQQEEWITQYPDVANQILDFLQNNSSGGCSNFDFNSVTESPIINNLNLSECNRTLIGNTFLTKEFLQDNPFGQKIFNSFIKNDTRHIFIESNADLPITVVAKTDFVRTDPFISGLTGKQVNIQFNPAFLNQASDITIVTYLFHEFLHAYIINLFHDNLLLTTYPQYTSLNSACEAYKNDPNYPNVNLINSTISLNLQNEMHDIYVDFIDDLANAIRDYAIKNNIKINNEIISLDYAKKLVWGSLSSENVFSDNLTVTEQQYANNIIMNETLNNNQSTNKKSCNE